MEKIIHIPVGQVKLEGELILPDNATSLVLFAHGSGSSRHSPRNNFVARVINDAGIGTLLFDLLTEEEDEVYETRFDIDLLTERLITATKWIQENAETKTLTLGYFGSSTGAAAALEAAAQLGEKISAVVSRGGRPDLAIDNLPKVVSPTLLIVGGDDTAVIGMNEEALNALACEKKMEIVPGATHLFEEEGTLEEVARLATEWFKKKLS